MIPMIIAYNSIFKGRNIKLKERNKANKTLLIIRCLLIFLFLITKNISSENLEKKSIENKNKDSRRRYLNPLK